jgi:hypothetical protein
MTSLTRGPLPASIYWRRRALLLGLGLVLVLLVSNLFGGDGEKPKSDAVATQVSGEPTTSAGDGDRSKHKPKKPKKTTTPQEPVLAQPDGPCEDSDIQITPTVEQADAGRPVAVTLQLRTASAEACTWRVSANHVTMKITSGADEIWTSRQCPRAVPQQDVVVRREVSTFVDVQRKARLSDDGFPIPTPWALPGTYHVHAAALGGEPAEAVFQLERPTAQVNPPAHNPAQPQQNQPGNPNQHEDQPKVR